MIRIEDALWEKLQKKGFFTNGVANEYLDKVYTKRMYENRIVRIHINGFHLPVQDIRSVFKQTKEEDMELISYYGGCVSYKFGKLDLDKTALNVAFKVTQRLRYVSDEINFKTSEYIDKPINIHRRETDDCDGYAVLSCYVCGLLGIPAFRRYVRAGYYFDKDGNKFGHATFIYLSTRTNDFYPLEGSCLPFETYVDFDKIPLRNNERYKECFWISNEQKSFGTSPLIQLIKW